jgi:hypothetical protein
MLLTEIDEQVFCFKMENRCGSIRSATEVSASLVYHLLVSSLYWYVLFQSLKSRGYVSEQFAWRHFYWYLTNEGISYLRNFLHLPAEVRPSVLHALRMLL